jgi:hypothetical protein
MTDLGGYKICGLRGGDPFAIATRATADAYCSNPDYKVCNDDADKANIICVPVDKHPASCPITDIRVGS